MVMIGFKYLISETWNSPSITMMLNVVPPESRGKIVSANQFMTTLRGTISVFLLGFLANMYKAESNPQVYGILLCIFIVFSYGGSLPFFYMAGIEYEKELIKQ